MLDKLQTQEGRLEGKHSEHSSMLYGFRANYKHMRAYLSFNALAFFACLLW